MLAVRTQHHVINPDLIMSRQDEAASSSDSRRRSLRPLETARFTGSPYVTSPSAFSPPDTSHPGTTFELKHLARGINGLPPARHATKRQESIPSVPEVKDEGKNAVYHHVEVAPGSTSLTDTMPSIVEGVRGNEADKAAGSSAVSGEDKVKQPLPPKTVHDPYVMSQWAELHKMDESRGRKSTGGVIDLSSSQSGGNQSEEPDIPTMMHARLRDILDLQMEISDMHLRLEDVDHNGQLGGTLTCPKNESMPQAGSPENKDDKMSFDGLQKREDGVMALFDKVSRAQHPVDRREYLKRKKLLLID